MLTSAVLISLLTCLALLPPFLHLLGRQMGQVLREEGPKSHAHKARTPTAGGLAFIFSTLLSAATCASFMAMNMPRAIAALIAVLVVALTCASLGLADDLAKVKLQSNKGLSESVRLKVETFIGLLFGVFLLWQNNGNIPIWLPFEHLDGIWKIGLVPFIVNPLIGVLLTAFLVVATANSLNLHDGMDGLASGTAFLVFCSMAFMLVALSPRNPSFILLAIVCFSAAGGLLGFFCFNRHPAKIFMGDTGSLFIGGLMAAVAAASGLLLWFIPLALIFILETLSVIIQVTYFKLTKKYEPEKPMGKWQLIRLKLTKRLPGEGKRIFRMTPLHHHFESLLAERNIQEAQVVAMFWLAQALICSFVLFVFCLVLERTV